MPPHTGTHHRHPARPLAALHAAKISLAPDQQGSTAISWATTNCADAQVSVFMDDGHESLFGDVRYSTGAVAPWIRLNCMLFRLCCERSGRRLLDSVKVIETAAPMVGELPPDQSNGFVASTGTSQPSNPIATISAQQNKAMKSINLRLFPRKLLALLPAALFLAAQGASFAQSAWSVGSSSWNTATNWSPNGVPGIGANVTVNNSSTAFTVSLNTSPTLNNWSSAGSTVVNTSIFPTGSSRTLAINGSLTKTGVGNLAFRDNSALTLSMTVGVLNLTASSAGTLTFGNANAELTGLNVTTANVGANTLAFLGKPDTANITIGTLNMAAGGTVLMANGGAAGKQYALNVGSLNGAGGTVKAANAAGTQVATLNLTGITDGIYSGTIVDGGAFTSVTKSGSATQTLGGASTYTGTTTINGGTLALGANGNISNSASIVVASNAVFNVSARSTPFTLAQSLSSQTLSNSAPGAIINGSTDCSAGTLSLVYDGVNPSFTITNGGMTLSALTTITVRNTGTQLAAGTSYKLIAKAAAGAAGLVAGAVTTNPITVTENGAAATATLSLTGGELWLNVVSTGSITANPTKITLAPGQQGSTTISWTTTNCAAAQVTVSTDGNPETLFGNATTSNGQVDPQITWGSKIFRLYGDLTRTKLLDSVEVIGTIAPLTVMPNGTLRLDNRPFTGLGVNYFDAFDRVLWNASDTSYEAGFQALGQWGIPFARLDLTGYQPIYANLFFTNRAEYFRRLDAVVASAERHGVGLIPSFFWTSFTFSDLAGEHLDQIAVTNSVTRRKMREFTTAIVSRYKTSRAIWAWEFGNEWNLMVDLPNAADFLPPTWTNLGNPATRDPARDILTTEIILPAMQEFANTVNQLDPGRPISTGHAIPRPSAWNLDQSQRALQSSDRAWMTDSYAQAKEIAIRQCPAPFDLLSIHVYGSDVARVPVYAQIAAETGIALYVGEFSGETTPEFNSLLAACRVAPLTGVWAYDRVPEAAADPMNTTTTNSRSWMLRALLPSTFSAWSRGLGALDTPGGSGQNAFGQYAFGAPKPGATPVSITPAVVGNVLTLEAVVRTNDPSLLVLGETSTSLTPGSWTSNGVSVVTAPDQAGVLPGCERRLFSVPVAPGTKKFLRLRAVSP